MTDAITREEKLMEAMATGNPSNIKPITREEIFLAKAGGQDVETPEPITRREKLLQGIIDNGGGGGSKPEGTIQITENGTHDVTEYASADVNIVYSGEGVPVEEYNALKADFDGLISGSISGEVTSDAKSVRKYAFRDCAKLTTADFPLLTKIYDYGFSGCTALTEVDFPLLTTVDAFAFDGCTALTEVDFPLLTTVLNNYTFRNCKMLKKASLPLVADLTASSGMFSGCQSLTDVNVPKVTSIRNNHFKDCQALTKLDLPNVSRILEYGFNNCISLKTLILRKETVCTLSSVNAFNGTPFAIGGTGGTVYVPQALIEEYKTATNWATLYAAGTVTFLPIEGSEYE